MLSIQDYYLKIQNNQKVYEVLEPTPLDRLEQVSQKTSNNVYLKREDLTPIFSFKIRGAFNKIANIDAEERSKGIITASAGNHAQGVAYSGRYFNCPTLIIMPLTSPSIKVEAVKSLGAKVVLHGDSFQDAEAHALEIAKQEGYVFVHAYDDPDIIIGQGTIAKEIVECSIDPDYIFICLGGGGLASGIGTYIKSVSPSTKLIGVEPEEAAGMQASIQAGKVKVLDWVGTFADGVAVKRVGKENFRICKEVLDDIVLVTTDEICSAIKDAYDDTRTIFEPSGALSLAGMKKYVEENNISEKTIVAIGSGANMNFDNLRHVAERASIGDKGEVFLAVTLEEKPGTLLAFCSHFKDRNITEFNYRYSGTDPAHILTGIEIKDEQDQQELLKNLKEQGVQFEDLSHNETAILHIRYMIGGKSVASGNEKILRFEFPERPGALRDFLKGMDSNWNVSLLHYRSDGSDKGHVLIGIQIAQDDERKFKDFVSDLPYAAWDETNNLAYKLFFT